MSYVFWLEAFTTAYFFHSQLFRGTKAIFVRALDMSWFEMTMLQRLKKLTLTHRAWTCGYCPCYCPTLAFCWVWVLSFEFLRPEAGEAGRRPYYTDGLIRVRLSVGIYMCLSHLTTAWVFTLGSWNLACRSAMVASRGVSLRIWNFCFGPEILP